MQSLHTVQEEGSGQPPAYQPAVWAEEEPSAAHPAHVLPAVPVLLQVRDQLRNDTLTRINEATLDPGSWSGVNFLHYTTENCFITMVTQGSSSLLVTFYLLHCLLIKSGEIFKTKEEETKL